MTDVTASQQSQTRPDRAKSDVFTVRGILSILATLAVIAVGGMLFFIDMPKANSEVASIIFGALIMVMKDSYFYAFGSSASSDRKTEALIAKGAPE